MIRRLLIIILVYTITCGLYGCWNYVEIEKRAYVLGIAIDKAQKDVLGNNSLEYMPMEASGPLYEFTVEVPIISRSQKQPSGSSGGTTDKQRDWNLTIVSNSFFEANREYNTRLNYPPYYSHLQAIVIGSEVAEKGISELLDMFLRDTEMRRKTKIFITPGKAADALHVIPKIDDFAAQYLKSLPDNNDKTSRLLHEIDLGKVSEAIHENRDFVLPKIIVSQYEVKDAGCAVFKDNEMVGWLDEIKTSYLKWITDFAKGGLVSVNLPEWQNRPVVLEVKKVKTKQKPIVKGNSVEMQLDIKANLSLGEINVPASPDVMNSEFISKLEEVVEKKIQEQVEDTISYVQKEYGADVFYFDINFERFAPRAWDDIKDNWDDIKDNWDDIFPTLKVNTNVEVKINQVGLIK